MRYAIGDSLFGLEAYPGREGQLDLVLWSERLRAVIAGDTLIDLGNGLEIPASWLPEGVTLEQVAARLRPLLDRPVEFVLPTHGESTDRAAPRTRPRLIPWRQAQVIPGKCFSRLIGPERLG
jgi:glyoxylase-like metal-dependent hydrolase (beta-lactamase superfamily II)